MQKFKGILACGLASMLIFASINLVINGSNAVPWMITLPVYAAMGMLLGVTIAFVFPSLNSIVVGALGLQILYVSLLLIAIFALDVTFKGWFTAINLAVVPIIGAICGAVYKFATR